MRRRVSIIEGSMRYYSLMILAVVTLVLLGIYSLVNIPKQEFPEFTVRQGVVVAVYPGATTSQIEQQVAKPLERYLFTFKEVKREKSYSMSRDGILYFMVELNDNIHDKDRVWSKIKLGLQNFKMQLPTGVVALIANDDFGDTSALLISLESQVRSYRELEEYMSQLQDRLFEITSVSNVRSYGVQSEQISIYFDKTKLAGYGIDQSLLMAQLALQGVTTAGGSVDDGQMDIPIHFTPSYLSEQEIEQQIIYTDHKGNTIRIKDIGRVIREYPTPKSFIENNGQRCVILSLEMHSGFNIVEYGKQVEAVLSEFSQSLPRDVQIVRIADQPKVVEESVKSFIKDLFLAIVIVILVMMILFPLRSAMLAGVTIPISVMISLTVMYILGIPLNTVTLAALIVVLGMIVDNSIIVIDGYLEYLDSGMSRWHAAVSSAQNYFGSIALATLCLCVIFFPLLFTMKGMMRDFLDAFPMTISIALLSSLVVAMLVIPFMEYKVIKVGLKSEQKSKFNLLNIVQRWYERLLDATFRHPYITIMVGVASVVVAAALFLAIGMQLMPIADRDQFAVEIYLPEGSSLEQTHKVSQQMYDILIEDERITSITSFVGCSSPRFQTTYAPNLAGANYAQFIVNTTSFQDTNSVLDDYAELYAEHLPNAHIRFKQLSYDTTPTPIEIRLIGDDIDSLKFHADRLISFMKGVDNLRWEHTNLLESQPILEVTLLHEPAAQLGITHALASTQIAMQYEGVSAGSIWEGDYSLPIVINIDKDSTMRNQSMVQQQYISSLIPDVSLALRQVAQVGPSWEHGQIVRRNGRRCLSVLADCKRGYMSKDVLPQIQRYLDTEFVASLPEGVVCEVGGYKETEIEVLKAVLSGLSISVILIFIVLLITFRRIKISLVALSSLTLIFFGAAGALFIFGLPFGLTAVMGVVSLMGIVVRNTIVMYERADTLRLTQGYTAHDAAYDAGKRRMMPIFLTSATTAVGVVPMILGGSSLWKPVGVVICIGTVWTTLMVVTVLPAVYWVLYRGKDNKKG